MTYEQAMAEEHGPESAAWQKVHDPDILTQDDVDAFRRVEEANANSEPCEWEDLDAEARLVRHGWIASNEQGQLFVTPKGVAAAAEFGR